ncbi:CLUMA_CG020377, isoform A [Clunio marinus]|uniref:NADH dehydrogenase [ubiquinone] 1 beta subcomplex subunit 7 n=1 Tax=Clunio marinus TaxID=568069 RepID=A0A1J1J6J7_9DIPT|nr:CLUMA_CG020377, isoform A [Clunio marinus]
MGSGFSLHYKPEVTPDPNKETAFDHHFGFNGQRKERVMIATEEEMISAKIKLEDRDYCAHKLIQYKTCAADVWPWAVKCAPEKHEYMNCAFEDYVMRMKEYERERRLMERKQRIAKKRGREELLA